VVFEGGNRTFGPSEIIGCLSPSVLHSLYGLLRDTVHSTDIFRDVGLFEAEPVGTRVRKCRDRDTHMYVWLFGGYKTQKWHTNARIDLTDLIHPRDLELRQDNDCPPSYTTLNGLNFTSYCNQRNPNNGQHKSAPVLASKHMVDKRQMR